jgi:hypothetical protein
VSRATAKPSLADAITANIVKRGPRCGVALLIEQLDTGHLADLDAAMANPAIPANAISKGLEAVGHDLPALTIQRHRRRDCNCPR